MLGVEDFWGKVAQEMPGGHSNGEIIKKLRAITSRRNQIVHEADIVVRAKAKQTSARAIDQATTRDWVTWIGKFVRAADQVIVAEV